MIPSILQRVKRAGLQIFTNGDYNVNLIGVRSKQNKANNFDDVFYCVFKQDNKWVELKFPCTTDAGIHWLENPSRPEGTAILVAGQYKSVYKLDLHAGKYKALCQRNGKVKVYRDSNKDEILDKEPESVASGYFGINIHRATSQGDSQEVNKWSAGCQVLQNSYDFDILIAVCEKSASIYSNKFTYTLLED
jgi:hypothetical protein